MLGTLSGDLDSITKKMKEFIEEEKKLQSSSASVARQALAGNNYAPGSRLHNQAQQIIAADWRRREAASWPGVSSATAESVRNQNEAMLDSKWRNYKPDVPYSVEIFGQDSPEEIARKEKADAAERERKWKENYARFKGVPDPDVSEGRFRSNSTYMNNEGFWSAVQSGEAERQRDLWEEDIEVTKRRTEEMKSYMMQLEVTMELERQQKDALANFSTAIQNHFVDPLADAISGVGSFKDAMQKMLASLLKDLSNFASAMAQSGGESGGSGMFGTIFTLAKIGISAYSGYSGGGNAMLTADAGGTIGDVGAYGVYGRAKGGTFPGTFKAFATGGIARKPTLGLVAEGGQSEAVVPLPDGRAIPVDMKNSGSSSGGNTYNIMAMDSQSFSEFAKKNSGAFAAVVTQMVNRGNTSFRSSLRKAG